jgi:hypothetical protein
MQVNGQITEQSMAADRFWPSALPPWSPDIPALGRRDDPKKGHCCCHDSHKPRNVAQVTHHPAP